MLLSASEFAKRAGVSLTTVKKWIEKGRISFEKNPDGGYLINAAELDRMQQHVQRVKGGSPLTVSNPLTPELGGLTPREMQAKLEHMAELVALHKQKAQDLEADRDRWYEEASRLTKVLPDLSAKAQDKVAAELEKQIEQLTADNRQMVKALMEATEKARNEQGLIGWLSGMFGAGKKA